MDDILLAAKKQEQLTDLQSSAISSLQNYGLSLAPEKNLIAEPWKYLGLITSQKQVRPQKTQLQNKVENLTDVQKLMGSINWLINKGLTNLQVQPLLEMLKGSENPTDVCKMIPKAFLFLRWLRKLWVRNLTLVQWSDQWEDPLHILEWLFLPFRPIKTTPGLF